ncbi:MAG: hypothetical protein JWN48_1175 [Myxococcaceae bacterium]|nr:hypothetical protein [Myxococcaceae bacterium]
MTSRPVRSDSASCAGSWRARSVVLWLTWLGLMLTSPASAQLFAQTVSVPMDDQVALSTDIWRDFFDATPRPVLLRRTPYGRNLDPGTVATFMNAGFIVVSQDVRGRGASGGQFVPFFTDKEDGRATIDWIAAQPWSNGQVGTYSASAEGIVQYMAMAAAPDALACAHVVMATPDVYAGFYPGGAWRTELGSAWLDAVDASRVIDLWKAHEVKDAYWAAATLSKAEMARVDHPVFVLGGFFDIFALDAHDVAQALAQNVAPSSRGDVFVVLGPWTHGGFGSPRQGQLLYPDDAAMPSYATDFLQYLSWCLLGSARPPFANVRYYVTELTDQTTVDSFDKTTRVVVKGAWQSAATWPPAETSVRTLFLRDDHQLGASAGEAAPIALALDPKDPTPSVGGGNFSTAAGPSEQATVDARADVYTATSEPFREETLLVGAPHARIWAASSNDDVDVVVRLEVVTPLGKSILFSDGVQRGRFVGGEDALRPLVPNQPSLFEVSMGPIALRLPAGHALRIAIAGASAPRYEANPNRAAPLASKPLPVANTLSIYRDALHPSRIELPLRSGAVPGSARLEPARAPELDGGLAPGADAGPRESEAGVAGSGALDAGVAAPGSEVDGAVAEGHGGSGCTCRVGPRQAHGSWRGMLSWSLALGAVLWRRRRTQRRP